MRHSRAALGSLTALLVATTLAVACASPPRMTPDGERTDGGDEADVVEVTLKCDAARGNIGVAVTPWHVRVKKGNPLTWMLTDTSTDGAEFDVAPKPPIRDWPFELDPGELPYRVEKGKPKKSKQYKVVDKDTRVPYNIVAYCPATSTSGRFTLLIDPIMIIPGS